MVTLIFIYFLLNKAEWLKQTLAESGFNRIGALKVSLAHLIQCIIPRPYINEKCIVEHDSIRNWYQACLFASSVSHWKPYQKFQEPLTAAAFDSVGKVEIFGFTQLYAGFWCVIRRHVLMPKILELMFTVDYPSFPAKNLPAKKNGSFWTFCVLLTYTQSHKLR